MTVPFERDENLCWMLANIFALERPRSLSRVSITQYLPMRKEETIDISDLPYMSNGGHYRKRKLARRTDVG